MNQTGQGGQYIPVIIGSCKAIGVLRTEFLFHWIHALGKYDNSGMVYYNEQDPVLHFPVVVGIHHRSEFGEDSLVEMFNSHFPSQTSIVEDGNFLREGINILPGNKVTSISRLGRAVISDRNPDWFAPDLNTFLETLVDYASITGDYVLPIVFPGQSYDGAFGTAYAVVKGGYALVQMDESFSGEQESRMPLNAMDRLCAVTKSGKLDREPPLGVLRERGDVADVDSVSDYAGMASDVFLADSIEIIAEMAAGLIMGGRENT
jgi:hypothetical protein